MKEFVASNYLIRLLDKSNPDELKRIQELRYKYLLKIYNEDLPEYGLDDDGYDKYSDTLLVINQENGDICGAYRLATKKTNSSMHFLMEDEYDCTPLKESSYDFCELSRAFVHKDYQNGLVITLLFLGIYHYVLEHDCKYFIGLCSFHETDPSKYMHGFSLLKRDYSFNEYVMKAVRNSFPLDYYHGNDIDEVEAKKELPGLLKMYLKFGCLVGFDGSIDYGFNCCDVLLVLNFDNLNKKYLDHFIRMCE